MGDIDQLTLLRAPDTHDIKADRLRAPGTLPEIGNGSLAQDTPLPPTNALVSGQWLGGTRSHPHFNEYHCLPLPHDQIQLTMALSPATLENPHAMSPAKVLFSLLLPPLSCYLSFPGHVFIFP
jgi:hypothetical protein